MRSTLLLLCAATAAAANPPRRLRLSLAGNGGTGRGAGDVVVTFTVDAAGAGPVCRYGLAATNLTRTSTPAVPPASYSYPLKHYTSDPIGRCTLTGLEPGLTYFYEVAANAKGPASAVHQFTAPSFRRTTKPIKIAFVGDLGQTDNSAKTRDHILAAQPFSDWDLLVIIGDMSYADSQKPIYECFHAGGCTPKRWDTWEDFFTPLGSVLPTMVLTGNHEIETPDAPLLVNGRRAQQQGTATPFLNYRHRFPMPGVDEGRFFYSFDMPMVHFVMLSSYDSYVDPAWSTNASKQYQWLARDLASVNRSETPWVVACTHSPWYNSNRAHHNEDQEVLLRAELEDLMHEYRVDLMLAGHVHSYERMHPVYQNRTDPTNMSTTYINIGDGGNREGPATTYLNQPEWSAFREPIFGHGELLIHNATHAEWHWRRNQDAETHAPADAVSFAKQPHGGLVATVIA